MSNLLRVQAFEQSQADIVFSFLHAQWDVAELQAKKEMLARDPAQLTVGLVMDKLVET